MILIHTLVGYLALLFLVLATLAALQSAPVKRSPAVPRGLRMAATGLLDLQIVLGVLTFIVHARWGVFLLHPLLMLGAVAVVHVLTAPKRPLRQQLMGYVIALLLMIAGILVGLR